ncbi:MAG: porin [Deltaproteobacteria bacterium]|nr:porin [Deltaproteobacteria bacterium]
MKKGFFVFLLLTSFNALAGENVGYDKGLYFKTDDDMFKMVFNVQLQPQFQYLSLEGADNNIATFQIRRARFVLSGNVFQKELTYKLQVEAVSGRSSTTRDTTLTEMTGPNLREGYLNYKFKDQAQIRAGQFKPAFNREELTSSTSLQFVDRSILNEVFSHGYDLGAMLHGAFFDKKLEYNLYVTNEGNNRNNINLNNEMLYGLRVAYNILGQHGYTQSDVTDSEEHQLVVGAAGSYNKPVAVAQDTIINATGDVAWRYNGFSFVGEGGYSKDTTAATSVFGYLAQAGYFVVPEKFEIAGRFAGVSPNTGAKGYEAGACLNYFIKGHNFKLQTDYNMLMNSALAYNGARQATNVAMLGGAPGFTQDQTDHRIRTQLQLMF